MTVSGWLSGQGSVEPTTFRVVRSDDQMTLPPKAATSVTDTFPLMGAIRTTARLYYV